MYGQCEAEQQETVRKSDRMGQELDSTVMFNIYERRVIILGDMRRRNNQAMNPTEAGKGVNNDTEEPDSMIKCRRCSNRLFGGGHYRDYFGVYGFCSLCIEEIGETRGLLLIKACTRCGGFVAHLRYSMWKDAGRAATVTPVREDNTTVHRAVSHPAARARSDQRSLTHLAIRLID